MILDDRFAEDVKDEVLTIRDELTAEEILPGLVLAIKALAIAFPDPNQVMDEVFRLLEEEEE